VGTVSRAVGLAWLCWAAGAAYAHPGPEHGTGPPAWTDADAAFVAEPGRPRNGACGAGPTPVGSAAAPDGPGPVPLVAAVAVLVALAAVGSVPRPQAAIPPLAVPFVTGLVGLVATAQGEPAAPEAQKHFEPFKDRLRFRSDADFLYVESDGLPDHRMMVGVTAWQQQVPLPQPYTGRNAWRIPLRPRLADKPISARTALFRGAIAVAVNGVPIFNALNNRGEDAYLAGELDEYGGHCGRADDYHYHAAPVHLEKMVGKGNPIGYALDGFPLFGFTGGGPVTLHDCGGRP
jgi:hypothetical protein